jgi:hypothetical protein
MDGLWSLLLVQVAALASLATAVQLRLQELARLAVTVEVQVWTGIAWLTTTIQGEGVHQHQVVEQSASAMKETAPVGLKQAVLDRFLSLARVRLLSRPGAVSAHVAALVVVAIMVAALEDGGAVVVAEVLGGIRRLPAEFWGLEGT